MIVIARLLWDTWNTEHIARHGVTQQDVEDVCQGDYIIRESYKGRIMVIGPTLDGRMLAVVLDPEGQGVYYPVTARSADKKERRDYQRDKGGEHAA